MKRKIARAEKKRPAGESALTEVLTRYGAENRKQSRGNNMQIQPVKSSRIKASTLLYSPLFYYYHFCFVLCVCLISTGSWPGAAVRRVQSFIDSTCGHQFAPGQRWPSIWMKLKQYISLPFYYIFFFKNTVIIKSLRFTSYNRSISSGVSEGKI